ncbi:DNA cytosine methyltransferase, partial [Pontibacter roseus]|uniref:DNA cytosine methyltransferase n=1 Tax=Pontibacter roseus TaxID=336989 RepID=UPI00037E2536
KVVDLFAGCGGMSLGFQNAGYTIEAAFDNWAPAIEVYKQNFTHPIYNRDLGSREVIEEIANYSPDMIIGGPPCQDFSIAGKREDKGMRANLTMSFADIVEEVRPEWVVMENVYNITKSKVLPRALNILKSCGYGITSMVLDASYLGVPQARKRFFLIGHLHSMDGFMHDELLRNQSSMQMTLHDYLGDSLGTDFYYMHPRSYNRRAVFSVYEPSSTIRGVNRPIPDNYKKHPADKSEINNNVRALTTKERSLIQTFPDWFQFNGSKTAMEQVIGNAVPVKMAEYVAKAITNYSSRSFIENTNNQCLINSDV